MEDEGKVKNNCSYCVWNIPQRLGEGTEGIGNERKNWDLPNYGLAQNSPGYLRCAVTQIPVNKKKNLQGLRWWRYFEQLPSTYTSVVITNKNYIQRVVHRGRKQTLNCTQTHTIKDDDCKRCKQTSSESKCFESL